MWVHLVKKSQKWSMGCQCSNFKQPFLGQLAKYQLQPFWILFLLRWTDQILFLPRMDPIFASDWSHFCVGLIPFLRRMNPIFGPVLAFPTAVVYTTPPQLPLGSQLRWDAFKTAWEPVSGFVFASVFVFVYVSVSVFVFVFESSSHFKWWYHGEMHLKLSENQFVEVGADFLLWIEEEKTRRHFFRHPGRVCGDMQLSVVDEKKGRLRNQ